MITIIKGLTYNIRPGDHFKLLLPDGTVLSVEQAGNDEFSIVRPDGTIAYIKDTAGNTDPDAYPTTGRG